MKEIGISAEVFSLILELSKEVFVLSNSSDNQIAFIHPKLADQLGFIRGELNGESIELILGPEISKCTKENNGNDHCCRIALESKNGDTAEVEITYHKINTASESYNCYFLHDELLQNSALGSLNLKKMFQEVLDTIPARIFWKDRNLVYLGSNKQFAIDAGIKPGDSIVGKTDFVLSWKKEEAEYFRKVDQSVIDNEREELNFIEPQFQADGTQAWLETNKVPLRNDKGEVIGVLGTYADITKQKNAQDEIKKHAKSLEIKNRELEQFAYIASHDLQEPLRTLTSFVELLNLEFGAQIDGDGKKYMGYINDSASRMRNMIQGLLDYSRLGRSMENANINCDEIVDDILKDFSYTIDKSKAIVKCHKLPIVNACKTELRVLFQNLIENALKFHKNGQKPKIELSASENENYWEFQLADEGIGIEEEYHAKIFTIFQRLNPKSDYPGAGIGLAYCKKIVDLMGGEIWIKPNKNQGSVFHFTIPKNEG